CGEQRLIVLIRKHAEEATNPAKRLAQEQISSGVIGGGCVSIPARELKLAIPTAENASRSKKIHDRVSNPFLDKLHVEDWLAISDQRAIHGKVEAPNQAAELPRIRTKLLASNGHIRDANGRAKPVHPSSPCFADSVSRRFHHGVVNFLELHSRPAHANKRDKRSKHFVAA